MSEVFVNLSGDASKLHREYQKIIDQAAKLDQKHKEIKQSSEQTFGGGAISALEGYATRMMSITAAVGAFVGLLKQARDLEAELAAKQRGDVTGLGPLAQLAMGDPAKARQLFAASRASYAQGAGVSLGEAGGVQFEIASANYERYRREVAELKATSAVPDPIGLLVGAAAFETNVGTARTGGFPRITSMLLGAAGKSPGQIPGIALGGAEAAITGVSLGLSPEEILAVTAVQAKATGNPLEGGMYAKNLFAGIEEGIQKGYLKRGRSVRQYMADIAALTAAGKADTEIIGADIRKYGAYRQLQRGMGQYDVSMGEITAAVQGDMFSAVTQAYKVEPTLVGARAQREAAAKLEISRTRKGVYGNLAEAVQAEIEQRTLESGAARWVQTGENWWQNMQQWLQGSERYVRNYQDRVSPGLQQSIEDAGKALRDAAEDLRNVSRTRAAANVQPE